MSRIIMFVLIYHCHQSIDRILSDLNINHITRQRLPCRYVLSHTELLGVHRPEF
jgi:hypothetical protein